MAIYSKVSACFVNLLCEDFSDPVVLSGTVDLTADQNTAHRVDIANPVLTLANFRGDVSQIPGTACVVTCDLPHNALISGTTHYTLRVTATSNGETRNFALGFTIPTTTGVGPVDILTLPSVAA